MYLKLELDGIISFHSYERVQDGIPYVVGVNTISLSTTNVKPMGVIEREGGMKYLNQRGKKN
jgi:hypothetical protein